MADMGGGSLVSSHRVVRFAALLWFCFAGGAGAQTSLALGAGAAGLSLDVGQEWSPELGGRLGVAGFQITRHDLALADNRYDATARLESGRALLDWHPLANGFRLSAGLVLDSNRATGITVPAADGTITIGRLRLPVGLVGSLAGKVDFAPLAPALSVGWGSRPQPHRLGGFFDLGAQYQGRPRITLTPEIPPGSPLDNPAARALLATQIVAEEDKIESRIDRYRVYPVLQFGLLYRF
jgi:hypothetical protein